MNPVEHIKIGKHIFPLYSHPACRAQIQESAYVKDQTALHMKNPRLQSAIHNIVEQLIQQGVTGNVSEENVAAYLEAALGDMGSFLDESTDSAEKGKVTPEPIRSKTPRGSSVARVCFPTLPPIDTKGKKSRPMLGLRKLSARSLASQKGKRIAQASSTEADLSDLPAPVLISSHALMGTDGTPKRSSMPVCNPMSESSDSDWKKAARRLFYSTLSLRLEDMGKVCPEEIEMRTGKNGLMKLQGAELRNLSYDAYSLLDVTMDGNSSAIRYRSKVPMSIFQQSHKVASMRPIGWSLTALDTRTNRVLGKPFVGSLREYTVKGSADGHKWMTEQKKMTNLGTKLELPQSTYRSCLSATLAPPRAS